MKTNYLRRSKNENRRFQILVTLVAIIAIALLVSSLMGGFIRDTVSSAWKGESKVSKFFYTAGEILRSKKSLIEENTALKNEVLSLKIESKTPAIVRDDGPGLTAGVLVRPPRTPYDVLVLDQGENDGVAVGNQVVLKEGVALGEIVEVSSKTSKLKLYSTNGNKFDAVLERFNLPVTIEGQGGGDFKVLMARDAQVEVGDKVLSAGLSARLLGVVGEINIHPTDPFKEVLLRSPINIFSLQVVEILP